jgi:uncharacterized protein YqjF (DUF2071 family)
VSSPLELLTTPARQAAVLGETDHRPWPLPGGSWLMAQTWDDLLFAHWRVPVEQLRALVPAEVPLDEFDGSGWLGITPFVISGFRLRGTVPLPWLSTFPEINVRTYVTVDGKPGIWFFSLDTSSQVAVEGARRGYKLPYFRARMTVLRSGGSIEYSSARREGQARPFVFDGRYRPLGDVFNASPGSLEWFLTERYCLYTLDRGRLQRADIHHPPWPLQRAEAEIELNTMPPDGIELPDEEPLLHFSRRQDVVIWPLEAVSS